MELATVLLLAMVAVLWLLWWTRRPLGLPPGPGHALPLVGHLHLLQNDTRELYRKWRAMYGDVFSLYMGSRLVVVLNGYDVIKEAFVKMAGAFSDRPHMFLTEKVFKGGVVWTSGPLWKEQRKAALEILRQLGMGKNSLADRIQEEINRYIQAIDVHQGAPVELAHLTQTSVSNNICSIILGQHFQYDDPVFRNYLSDMNEFNKAVGAAGAAPYNFIPLAEHLPGDPLNGRRVLQFVCSVQDTFLRKQIARHSNNNTQNSQANDDFIFSYLRQMKKKQDSGKDTTLSDDQLLQVLSDLFFAGTETTSTAITCALMYFLHFPQVQEKCFETIKKVVGTDRAPTMSDRQEMTYLEATILEVLRFGQIAPFAASHGTSADVTLRGYVIPRDTIVLANLSSVLTDPDVWGDPDKFRPDRFIGPDGKLKTREELIPFGIGRRVCLGESLARMELYLYLASLIQRFRFLPEDPANLPSLCCTVGGTMVPNLYKIRAVPRTLAINVIQEIN